MDENKEKKKYYPGVFQAINLVLLTFFVLLFISFVMAVILRVNHISETDLTNPVTYILLVIVVPILTFSLGVFYAVKKKDLSLDYIIGSNVKNFS
ncbi:MAG: hypothetical protein ACOCRL_00005, partial [Bacillota bacterium]